MIYFYKTPAFLKKISKSLIWEIDSKNNSEIYLTFDDGPIPHLTESVLNTLLNYNAKATFFCVGENVSRHPLIFNKILERGHAVGNHTYNHLKGWTTPNNQYLENIEKCQNAMTTQHGNSSVQLFRPPHGQITWTQLSRLKNKYKIIMWDVLAYDFDISHTGQKSLYKLISNTVPGSIVVFHDNYEAETKLKFILPKFLDYFSNRGFEFKKIE